jgi:IS30 family transposase
MRRPGPRNSYLATLVERHGRYVMLVKAANKNTNGLLRQYFPKGTDLPVYSQKQLNKVARQLKERPRKTLAFETPAERFNACVALIG